MVTISCRHSCDPYWRDEQRIPVVEVARIGGHVDPDRPPAAIDHRGLVDHLRIAVDAGVDAVARLARDTAFEQLGELCVAGQALAARSTGPAASASAGERGERESGLFMVNLLGLVAHQ